jgi:hypothetical protein
VQQCGELSDFLSGEAGEQVLGDAAERGGDGGDECPPLRRYVDDDRAPVAGIAAAPDQPLGLQTVEQPGHARGVGAE